MSKKAVRILVIIILAIIVASIIISKNENSGKNINNTTETQDIVNKNVEKNMTNIFRHPSLGFSFEYLNDYNLSQLKDDVSETALVRKDGNGAQIYISDFSADVVFDAELVERELAGEKMEDLKNINMAGGFPAVSFSSSDPSLGDTLEVWFERGGKLYQITAQVGQDELLKTITDSWKFE